MTDKEIQQSREALQLAIEHFLTVTSDLIEAVNNHMDKVYGKLEDEDE